MAKNKIDTIVFDLWGTLFVGMPDELITLFYQHAHFPGISDRQRDQLIRMRFDSALAFIQALMDVSQPGSYVTLVEHEKEELESFFNDYRKMDMRAARWIAGAKELLKSLSGEGYRMIAVSNLWWYQEAHITKKIEPFFDELHFSCSKGATKDAMLEKMTADGTLNASTTLLIGDSYEDDIMLAHKLGLHAQRVLVGGPIRPEKILAGLEGGVSQTGNALHEFSRKTLPSSILFITPPYFKLHGSHNNRLNLSVTTLAEMCAAWEMESKVYNADGHPSETYISRYDMIFNSIDFYNRLEGDAIWEGMAGVIEKRMPEVVLITCGDVVNASKDSGIWGSSLKAARIVRQINPSAYIIGYGSLVGADIGDFNVVIDGEAEEIWHMLLKERPTGRVSGGLATAGTLAKIANFYPEERLLGYFSKKSYDTLYVRRGCEGTCNFCQVAFLNTGRVSFRPFDSVIEDVRMRRDRYGLNNIYFTDANFTGFQKITTRFCHEFHAQLPDIKWRIESRFDSLSDELVATLAESGCTSIKLGLENPLDGYQANTKRVTFEDAKIWVRKLKEIGIQPVLYMLLGGMWMTEDEYKLMFEKTRELDAAGYVVSLYAPYPGTFSGISQEEWNKWGFTGSHLDIRLVDYWKIPRKVLDMFFEMETAAGRRAHDTREFISREI